MNIFAEGPAPPAVLPPSSLISFIPCYHKPSNMKCVLDFMVRGVIPLPTFHPSENLYNGLLVARKSLKSHWTTVQPALSSASSSKFSEVWVGQYGCKLPPEHFLVQAGAWHRAVPWIWDGKRSTQSTFVWRALFFAPFCQGWIAVGTPIQFCLGPEQGRGPNHLGNPGGVCRFSQAEVHPSIFTIIPCAHNSKLISNAAAPNHEVPQGRKNGFTNLVDTVCSNVDKIGGCRLEVRVRGNPGLSLRNGIQAGIAAWLMLLGKDIHVKKVKVSDYRALCQARIGCSHGSKCVQGDARHRPHRCSDSCGLVCIGG